MPHLLGVDDATAYRDRKPARREPNGRSRALEKVRSGGRDPKQRAINNRQVKSSSGPQSASKNDGGKETRHNKQTEERKGRSPLDPVSRRARGRDVTQGPNQEFDGALSPSLAVKGDLEVNRAAWKARMRLFI